MSACPCGPFRLAEDYRDHLPCFSCEPAAAAKAQVTQESQAEAFARAAAVLLREGREQNVLTRALREARYVSMGSWRRYVEGLDEALDFWLTNAGL